jgi:hypothetical protein
MSDFDSPWKEVLEAFFEAFLAFFFPEVHAGIDWSRPIEFLDKELQQLWPEAEVGRRAVDKLVKVWTRDGRPQWVVIHVEVQAGEEGAFARRMFVYNYRLFDRFDQPAVSLAVLADDRPGWRPSAFRFERWGCRGGLEFPVVKLLDWAGREEELLANPNPFATVTLAYLKTRETRGDFADRQVWKVRLVRHLYELGLTAEQVRQLFRFLDWVMELPADLDRQFWRTIKQLEEERKMPFVSSAARFEREEGFNEGKKEGFKEGQKEGFKEGQKEGQREVLLEALEVALELKFGADGLSLLPQLQQQPDPAVLRTVHQALRTAASVDDLRRLCG